MTDQTSIPSREALKSVREKFGAFLRTLPEDELGAVPYIFLVSPAEESDVQGYTLGLNTVIPTAPQFFTNWCQIAHDNCESWATANEGGIFAFEQCMHNSGCGG